MVRFYYQSRSLPLTKYISCTKLWTDLSRHATVRYEWFSSSLRPLVYSETTDSVTRSPLYSIYGETIAGVTILRAFGASSKFLRDMLCCVDTVSAAK